MWVLVSRFRSLSLCGRVCTRSATLHDTQGAQRQYRSNTQHCCVVRTRSCAYAGDDADRFQLLFFRIGQLDNNVHNKCMTPFAFGKRYDSNESRLDIISGYVSVCVLPPYWTPRRVDEGVRFDISPWYRSVNAGGRHRDNPNLSTYQMEFMIQCSYRVPHNNQLYNTNL